MHAKSSRDLFGCAMLRATSEWTETDSTQPFDHFLSRYPLGHRASRSTVLIWMLGQISISGVTGVPVDFKENDYGT